MLHILVASVRLGWITLAFKPQRIQLVQLLILNLIHHTSCSSAIKGNLRDSSLRPFSLRSSRNASLSRWVFIAPFSLYLYFKVYKSMILNLCDLYSMSMWTSCYMVNSMWRLKSLFWRGITSPCILMASQVHVFLWHHKSMYSYGITSPCILMASILYNLYLVYGYNLRSIIWKPISMIIHSAC
jgi:hypothetical protein